MQFPHHCCSNLRAEFQFLKKGINKTGHKRLVWLLQTFSQGLSDAYDSFSPGINFQHSPFSPDGLKPFPSLGEHRRLSALSRPTDIEDLLKANSAQSWLPALG